MTLRVVVADDHGIVREGLAAVLSAREGFELVGTATTAAEAVRAAVTLRPDVVVMDIQMPDRSGIEATREIRRAAPDVAVLMLTMFDDDDVGLRRDAGRRAGLPAQGRRAGRRRPRDRAPWPPARRSSARGSPGRR